MRDVRFYRFTTLLYLPVLFTVLRSPDMRDVRFYRFTTLLYLPVFVQ